MRGAAVLLGLALAGAGFALGRATRSGVAQPPSAPERAAATPRDEPAPPTGLAAERDLARAEAARLAARVEDLEAELAAEASERFEREMQFLDFTSAVATLGPRDLPFVKELLSPEPGRVDEPPPEPDPAQERRAERAREILRTLRALLQAEWVRSLDLLEVGELDEDGWIGPVVFRLLDDLRRPAGSLTAERLRLTASRAGRLVTLVLEDGAEHHGGEARPFRDGVRRIALPGVDPAPFLEGLPELFAADDLAPVRDDGLWDVARVRAELGRLLGEDASGSLYRLRHAGGVRGASVADVHLVHEGADGTLRHLFADELRIERHGDGIALLLLEGVTAKDGELAPFLDGRYRIYLPRARAEEWERARLPGLSEPDRDRPLPPSRG